MSEVVKLLQRRIGLFILSLAGLFITCSPIAAQPTVYTAEERCAALPSAAPATPFDGMLVTVDADATRAFRDGVATTYVLAFGGGNFLSAGAVSPDGAYFAVPNGVITTVTSSDIRYTVQEIRILTTGTVPRIVTRLPWRASFPVGTAFTSSGGIPPIRWLDDTHIAFVTGTVNDVQTLVAIDVFAGGDPVEVAGLGLTNLSPDGSRGVALVGGMTVLVDALNGDTVAVLPQTPSGALQFAWSPDGTRFAMTDVVDGAIALRLYDAGGVLEETVTVLPPEQVLWNLRWSPDGAFLAYTAFDPQSIENRLHVVNLTVRTVTDTCLPLVADVNGRGLSVLAWSPDSTRLAILTRQTSARPAVQIYTVASRSRYTLVSAAGRLFGWYP